jgi:hypothetical protein
VDGIAAETKTATGDSLDVALARSSDRYGKFNWWSHDVGDPDF